MSAGRAAGIPAKYAGSLFSAAKKLNKIDAIEKDVKAVKDLYVKDKAFGSFVKDPTLNRVRKRTAVIEVLKAIGVSGETQKFFGVLAENGRLGLLNEVANAFDAIVRENRGDLSVSVISAEELTSSQKQSIASAIGQGGKSATINYDVRPSIQGGLIVQIGDRYVDLSIASRVKKLTQSIKESV